MLTCLILWYILLLLFIRKQNKQIQSNLHCLKDISLSPSNSTRQLVWDYKMNLTQSGRIEELARDVCENELQEHPECVQGGSASKIPGHTISCMTEQLDQIKVRQSEYQQTVYLDALTGRLGGYTIYFHTCSTGTSTAILLVAIAIVVYSMLGTVL